MNHRYKLIFPFESDKIYHSSSLRKVTKICYKQFKKFNDIDNGIITIYDIDDNINYDFRINGNIVKKIREYNNNQSGAALPNLYPILKERDKSKDKLLLDEYKFINMILNPKYNKLTDDISELLEYQQKQATDIEDLKQSINNLSDKIEDFITALSQSPSPPHPSPSPSPPSPHPSSSNITPNYNYEINITNPEKK